MKKESVQQSNQSDIIAVKAVTQKMNTGVVSEKCPHCNSVINVILKGSCNEYISAICNCGYINHIERGI